MRLRLAGVAMWGLVILGCQKPDTSMRPRAAIRRAMEDVRTSIARNELDLWHASPSPALLYLIECRFLATEALCAGVDNAEGPTGEQIRNSFLFALGAIKDPHSIEWLRGHLADEVGLTTFLSAWCAEGPLIEPGNAYLEAQFLTGKDAWSRFFRDLYFSARSESDRALILEIMEVHFNDSETLDFMTEVATAHATSSESELAATRYLVQHDAAYDRERIADSIRDLARRGQLIEALSYVQGMPPAVTVPVLLSHLELDAPAQDEVEVCAALKKLTFAYNVVCSSSEWSAWYESHKGLTRDDWFRESVTSLRQAVRMSPVEAGVRFAEAVRAGLYRDVCGLYVFREWTAIPEMREGLCLWVAAIYRPVYEPRLRPIIQALGSACAGCSAGRDMAKLQETGASDWVKYVHGRYGDERWAVARGRTGPRATPRKGPECRM